MESVLKLLRPGWLPGVLAICTAALNPIVVHATPTPLPGEIATNTVLTTAKSPYIAHNNVTVDNKAILTIQPGVVIKFDQGVKLQIGGGEGSPGFLIAKGVKAGPGGQEIPTPIHFLATLANPTHGYWSGILFNNSQYRSVMDHCDVSNAGAGGDPAIRVGSGEAPTITNCSITWGDGDGVQADGSFTSFDGNTIAHFKGIGMNISSMAAGAVGPHNKLADNGHDYIKVSGAVNQDEQWTNNSVPFFSDDGIKVEGAADGKDATLKLDPGVHLVFAHGQKLTLGWNNTGSLNAAGTADKPVVFSGDPDWAGIETPKCVKLTLDHCVIEKAADDESGIHLSSGAIAVTNSTIGNGGNVGVLGEDKARFTAFHGNTLTGVKGVPAQLDARLLAGLEADNKLTGNSQDVVRIAGNTVDADGEWRFTAAPYLASQGIQVEAPDGTDAVTLTLDPGVTIRFADDQALTLGWNNQGCLKAAGTAQAPIVFTSSQKTPSKGDWSGINFSKSGSDTDLEGVRIEYAGKMGGDAALRGGGDSRGQVSGCTIAHSGNGVDLGGSKVKVTGLQFEDVDSGTTTAPAQ